MPFNQGHQSPGNPIPAAGWNEMVDEIKRLGSAKLDTTGGTVSGPLAVQQTLSVTGGASLGGTAVNGALSVSGQANVGSGASVNGALSVAGTAAVAGTASFGDIRVGSGAGAPKDNLEVVGISRIGTAGNPIRFTSVWSGFPDSTTNQPEICNSTESIYQSLMIVGNKSRPPNNARIVGIWDRLEVHGLSCANSFCNLSDGRLKTDVAVIDDPLDRVARLRGVSFRWKADPTEGDPGQTTKQSPGPTVAPTPGAADSTAPGTSGLGVIAQEVAEVFPALVSTMGAQEHLGVDYSGLTAVLIEAVKQLKTDNDDLRRRVQDLEADRSGTRTG